MRLFRVGGIPLAIHFTFFLLLAVNAFDGWAEGGWAGVAWSTALLVAFFGCVVLHELGHALTARRYGIGVSRILLMPIGGMAEFDSIPREPKRELLITLAGPALNFVLAGLLWLVLPADADARLDAADFAAFGAVEFGAVLLHLNLAMGIFNFVPAFPMDGGRILRALLVFRLPYLRATFWAAAVGKVVCLAGGVAAAFFQPLAVALFLFIFVVGEMEYRATKRREIEDAHFRATLVRLHGPLFEPPVEEPPVLIR